jgi:hypothetical protein
MASADREMSAINEMLSEDTPLVVSLDIDGPVKEPGPHLEPHPGAPGAITELSDKADAVALNSGKPIDYQRELRDRYAEEHPEIADIDLIGGMGTVAEIDGDTYHFGEEDIEDYREIKSEVISLLADKGWKASMQNNSSRDVGVVRVEAENGKVFSRGNSRANPLFSDLGTQELYERYFGNQPGFSMVEDYSRDQAEGKGGIVFDLNPESAGYVADIARVEQPFIGLRFEREGDEVVFYRDDMDRPVKDDIEAELESVIEGVEADWKLTHHGDGGTEYWKPGIGKETGLESYIDERFDEAAAVHIGDSRSDLIQTERIGTVPQYGTELYDHMDRNEPIIADITDLAQELKAGMRKQDY